MKVQSTLAALLFALFLGACGGGEAGDECEVTDDCDDGLICVELAECAGGSCIGICAQVCSSDADCPGEQLCGAITGADRVCGGSVTGASVER